MLNIGVSYPVLFDQSLSFLRGSQIVSKIFLRDKINWMYNWDKIGGRGRDYFGFFDRIPLDILSKNYRSVIDCTWPAPRMISKRVTNSKWFYKNQYGLPSPLLLEFVDKTFIFEIKFSGTMNPIFVVSLLALACSTSATLVLSTTATTL